MERRTKGRPARPIDRRRRSDALLWLHPLSAFGLLVPVALSWALSEDRRAFSWRLVGLSLQIGTIASGMTGAVIGLLPGV